MDRNRSISPRPVAGRKGPARTRVRRVSVLVRAAPALASFLLAAPLSAQVAVGFTAGQTKSTILASRLAEFEQSALAGATVGVAAILDVHRHFGLTIGVASTSRGTSYAIPGWAVGSPTPGDGVIEYERRYVEISVLGRAVLPLRDRKASLYAVAGPIVDVASGCEVWFVRGASSGSFSQTLAECRLPDYRGVIELAQQYDLGATGGIGGDIAIPWGMRLSAEVLYAFGLKSDGLNCEDVRNRTRTIRFGLSYSLGRDP